MPPDIFEFVRSARDAYYRDSVTIVDGYDYSQHETLRLCELYSNSRYLQGQEDALGRIKPFYNIVNRLVTLSDTAEDIDRKDITITSDDPEHYVTAFMFTKEGQRWMEKSGFAHTLNEMTHTRGKYGGVLVKKSEGGGELHIDVVDWRNVITDQTRIVGGVIVERHFYTPSDLIRTGAELGWDRDKIDECIAHAERDQDDEASAGFGQRKTPTPNIEIWEAHGPFPKSYTDPDAEEGEFEDRVFVLGNLDREYPIDGSEETILESDCVLFSEAEKDSPYKYLPYERVPGRGLGRGRIEAAFESQAATNDIILKQKTVTDHAAMVLYATDDQKFGGRNMTRDKKTGDVLKLSKGSSMVPLNTTSASLPHFPGLIDQWNTQIERASSTHAANTGEALPSGTPYRLGAILNQEANSIFNDRRDEMGVFIAEIWRDWVIPYLKERLSKRHTLVSDFELEELRFIDDAFVNYEVRERFLERLFETKSLEAAEAELPMLEQDARERVSQTKGRRFLDVPEGFYDGVEFDLSVEVTNEKRQKAVYLETLSNILTTVTNTYDPNSGTFRVLEDPKLSRVFNQIMETAGYSPVEFQSTDRGLAAPVQGQGGFQPPQMPPSAPIGAANEELNPIAAALAA